MLTEIHDLSLVVCSSLGGILVFLNSVHLSNKISIWYLQSSAIPVQNHVSRFPCMIPHALSLHLPGATLVTGTVINYVACVAKYQNGHPLPNVSLVIKPDIQ